jgi:hypothetical protein
VSHNGERPPRKAARQRPENKNQKMKTFCSGRWEMLKRNTELQMVRPEEA